MKDFKCKYCGKIFNDKRKLAGHATHCKLNPNYEVNLKKCKQNISKANNKINKSNELRNDLFCIYCGNTAILKDKLEGKFRPQGIIPFTVTKEDAIFEFQKHIRKKILEKQ